MRIEEFEYPQIDLVKTGKLLRILSRRKKLSVKEMQDALGLASNQAIYDWFNGKSLPTLSNLYALSKLLQIPLDDLVIEKDETMVREMMPGRTYINQINVYERARKRLRMYQLLVS